MSASAKAAIVGKDFKERGLRRILNFGHTYGHAVESFNTYRLSHGVSVAVGMMVAVAISEKPGLVGKDTVGEDSDNLEKFPSKPYRCAFGR